MDLHDVFCWRFSSVGFGVLAFWLACHCGKGQDLRYMREKTVHDPWMSKTIRE